MTMTTPGVAPGDAAHSQPGAFDGAVNFKRLKGVAGTGRVIPAGWAKQRRDHIPIGMDRRFQQVDERLFHRLDQSMRMRASAVSRSSTSFGHGRVRVVCLPMRT